MCTKISFLGIIWAIAHTVLGQDMSSIRYAAENGDSWAQNSLGLAYEMGEGVAKNPNMAFAWFEKAANKGDKYAYYNLGRHFQYGLSVPKDMDKAYYWYERAAKAYHPYSCYIMGHWYIADENPNKNNYKAAAYFKDAAFTGCKEGKAEYGRCHAYGIGVKKDSIKALLWLNRAIEDEYYQSYWIKGKIYQEGASVQKNERKAFDIFQTGDSYEEPYCQMELGLCYLNGIGTDCDTLSAITYFEKAAQNNLLEAQRSLGYIYKQGMGTLIPKDKNQSISWFEKAAEQNDETSYRELIYAYMDLGNDNALFSISGKGGKLGFESCLNSLAYCYAQGKGTPIDFNKAIATIERAISLFPNSPNLYDSKGEILWMKGSKKAAKAIWKKVGSLDPTYYNRNDTNLNRYIISSKK